MSTSREIRVLHLEPTDVCQAACPSCARETDPVFDKSRQHHLTLEQIRNHMPDTEIQKLHKMFMCGNYGDPAAGQFTEDIYNYFRSVNSNITLGMNTNGALQNTNWWHRLGRLFHGANDYVVFSIDGLADTNSIYRRGVNWYKLLDNIKSYIDTGASAHWDMLVYRHNEHQINDCEQLARRLGFRWFRAKVSRRELPPGLERPIQWQPPMRVGTDINCHALQEKSLYIDAQGRASPCCWLGSRQHDFVTDFDAVQRSWHTSDHDPVCLKTCSQYQGRSVFAQQWQKETQLC